jgi:small subunit ribosomal protein S8e
MDKGNFAWGSETMTRKVRILDVVYNASNNELVRTKTLVKGCIVEIDAAEFKKWYETQYNVKLEKKGTVVADAPASKQRAKVVASRQKERVLDAAIENQLTSHGRLLAKLSSRPGQCGRCDGYILEGKELEFYSKQLQAKKKGKKQ